MVHLHIRRGLELAQRRRAGLQHDLAALQREMRAVEADIAQKHAAQEALRRTLAKHRSSHETVVGHLDARLKQIDREAMLATRPHLRTADRVNTRP